jgi:hypothetical protein
VSTSREDDRNQELHEAVNLILWENWDPIGVNDIPVARDEYRGYVPSVVRLLQDGADETKLSEHLHSLERPRMGIETYADHRKAVAQKLLSAFHQHA